MVKNKKNFAKKGGTVTFQVGEAKEQRKSKVVESDPYDSMIENGTSDESGNDDESMSATDQESGDDGFSDQEDVSAEPITRKPTKAAVAAPLKRKPEPNSAPAAATSDVKKLKSNAGEREKVKPPKLEEINELKETRNLFHSNLFRLQVKEMLGELRVKEKYTNYVSVWLEQFKDFVKQLKTAPAKEDATKLKWLRKSSLQLPLALEHLRLKKQQKPFDFQFVQPTAEPYLIGAAATQTLLGPKFYADICLSMPAACFQKENYLNLVYDQKRALFLTFIADRMLQSKHFEGITAQDLHFNYFANDPLKPILEITPSAGANGVANKMCIRLFVAAEETTFKLNRFVPWNNNVRASIFDGDDDDDDQTDVTDKATPHYNAGVLFDLTMHRNQRELNDIFDGRKNFQEGLILLKVWLRQRELHVGFSGVHSHILAMFVVWLVKQRKLHANMSSYQVARTVWNQLAYSAWDEAGKGITLCPVESVTPNQPTLEQFHTHYDVVFVDVTGFYNICANLSVEMYRRVRAEAKLAVDMLNDMKLNSFQEIFMTKCPLYTQFDHILKINNDDIIEQILDLHVSPADKCNYGGYAYPQLLKVVTSLLRKGLGQRVHALLSIEHATAAWPATDQSPSCAKHLHLGIILNPEHAYEVLDKGPESIAAEAAEFRKFWGDKAQLRRFQDGSITESVVWAASTDPLTKRRLVVRSIVLHLLRQHFQIETKDIEYVAGEFDMAYKLTAAFKTDRLHDKRSKVEQHTNAEAMALPVIRVFDDLARKLQGLSELPLEITSVAGISAVFRYCEPTPLLPQARSFGGQFYAGQVLRGVIQLGLSSKWPGELEAMRELKKAFYSQIAQMLREKHHLRTKVSYEGVFVIKHGYCFAFELANPKEVALLKREKTERGITQYVDCAASIALQKRHYVLPKLTGALHGLYQLHPSFGGAVMIAKRWLHTQLIDDGLWPDECTELLIAAQYLKTHAQQVTCSPQTAFFRFLQLLAHTDWRSELFLLNFNNAMDESQVSALEQRFYEERDTFPSLCIATAYDQQHCGLLWSSFDRPNVNVLARVTILARQALAIIEPSLLSSTESFIKPARIFTASSEGYDLVIQLKNDIVPNTLACEFGSPFTAFAKPNWRLPLADSNFIKDAVAKLREMYSDFAAFFYNPCGGKEIGVIWKPQIFNAKEFKVTDVNACNLSSDEKHIQCKKETLIEDFKFILKDYFVRIDTVEAVLKASRTTVAISRKSTPRYFVQASDSENTESTLQKDKTTDKLAKSQNKSKKALKAIPTPATQKPVKPKIKLVKSKKAINGNSNISEKSKSIVKKKSSVKKARNAT